jgi:hypothetical protein
MNHFLKPEHSAFLLVAFVFLFAAIAALREGQQVRENTADFTLCPLCGQEVPPEP